MRCESSDWYNWCKKKNPFPTNWTIQEISHFNIPLCIMIIKLIESINTTNKLSKRTGRYNKKKSIIPHLSSHILKPASVKQIPRHLRNTQINHNNGDPHWTLRNHEYNMDDKDHSQPPICYIKSITFGPATQPENSIQSLSCLSTRNR